MGNMVLAATTTAKHNSPTAYLIILVLIGFFYLVIYRPQRRRQQRSAQTQKSVEPGQTIRTTAGIYGTIVSIDDQDMIVQIAPGVEVRMLRRALMEVIPDDIPGDDMIPADDALPGDDAIHDDDAAPADDSGASPEPHQDDTRSDDWDSGDRNI
jgi:preprotein translocase subunit YajC